MNKPKRTGLIKSLFQGLGSDERMDATMEDNFTEQILLNYYIPFVQNHPDLTLIFSLDGEIDVDGKRNINNFLGFRARETIQFRDLIAKEQFNLLVTAFNKARNGTTEQVKFDILNKKGETINLAGTFIPIETPSKRIEAISLILRDMTTRRKLENENKLKSNHLEQAQEIANIGSWEYDILHDEIKCSKSCYKLVGLKPGATPSKEKIFAFVHPDDRRKLLSLLDAAIMRGVAFVEEVRINHAKTNELRFIKIKVEVESKENKIIKLIGVIKDHTNERNLENELRKTNQDYLHIFDNLHAGFWMWDVRAKKLTFASQGLSRILEKPLSVLYENPNFWDDIIFPEHRNDYDQNIENLKEGEHVNQYYQIITGNGEAKWVHEQTIPRVDESGGITHLFGRVVDITNEMEMRKKLEFLAKYDPITSLPNHYSLHEKLRELIADKSIVNFALFYIDLDNFHWVIDYLGHQMGDKILKAIANRLSELCPENGFVSKENNDVYTFIIFNYPDTEMIYNIAENIVSSIAKPVQIDGYEFHVTASLGISFYPDNGSLKLPLLENARTALFHAKNLGKNNYQIYSFDDDISAHKKYMLEKDLRQAIENEEFELYYQPQVDAKTNAIVGAEALIRWNHKDWGVVSPDEFIPIAEEKHLIDQIGDWVIRQVCHQLHLWQNENIAICPISINISPIRFLKEGIMETINIALNHNSILPKYIKLEITESSILQNNENVLNTLQQLRDLGVKIALDDFGKGYSAFTCLQKFDFDVLKIDQSFIQNIFSNQKSETKDAAIVSTILHLAHALDIDIVAEGVEVFEQLTFLAQKQCNIIQGYIYSKPVPAIRFEQLLQKRYLKPLKQKKIVKPKQERRKYFRFAFPSHLPAKMYITEINKRAINIGYATILIENISLGGIRFLSTLSLPVISDMKFNFEFELMEKNFKLDGIFVYKNEERLNVFSYGVSFHIAEGEKNKLAKIINKMTVFSKLNQKIPYTQFIEEDPYAYFAKTNY